MATTHDQLPDNLPVPVDDGGSNHLLGAVLPSLLLNATRGARVDLAAVSHSRWILFVYPMTGVPGEDLPGGWDEIPGARGCTSEACGFRDNFDALRKAGANAIYGLSTQDTAYQSELVDRLHLPYAMLSDTNLLLRDALAFPSFEVNGMALYKRMTLVLNGATIEHVFYPVFPPNEHATRIVEWLEKNPANSSAG